MPFIDKSPQACSSHFPCHFVSDEYDAHFVFCRNDLFFSGFFIFAAPMRALADGFDVLRGI